MMRNRLLGVILFLVCDPMFFPYLLAIIFTLSFPIIGYLGEYSVFNTIPIAFVLIPFFDWLAGENIVTTNLRPMRFRVLCWGYAVLQLPILLWALIQYSLITHSFAEGIGLIFSTGIVTGAVGISAGHELIHRPHRSERALGVLLLSLVCYAHFRISHVYWHHRYVATPADPSSAKAGESLYRFWLRSIFGNLVTAWKIESERIFQRSSFLKNRIVHYGAFQSLLYFGIATFLGWRGVVFFAAQSVIAILLLESINYIEHYGLTRKKRSDGSLESPLALHSWDCGFRFTNWFLFNLGRHAHHHLTASVPYEKLEIQRTAPRMPAGYATMILLSLLPPLWRKVMDPKLTG